MDFQRDERNKHKAREHHNSILFLHGFVLFFLTLDCRLKTPRAYNQSKQALHNQIALDEVL
jgi:hypothetical protein